MNGMTAASDCQMNVYLKTNRNLNHVMKAAFLLATIIGASLIASYNAAADSGILFVANNQNGQIYEYTSNGNQSTFGAAGSPYGLALDSNANLYAADEGGNIFEYAPNGSRTTFASGLNTALGLTFDDNGNLFVANAVFSSSGTIYKYTPYGSRTTFATGLGTPVGLAFSSGYLFVADAGSGAIYKYNSAGTRTTFASGLSPNSLAFDSTGNLFESDESGCIYKFDSNGNRSTFVSGLSANSLVGLAFDSDGNLYVSDITANIIRKFAPNGNGSTFASGLNTPTGLVFEPGIVPPIVNISNSGSNTATVSWSSFSPNFFLQTNSNLTTTNWQAPGFPISNTNGTNYSVSIPKSGGKLFFRLKE